MRACCGYIFAHCPFTQTRLFESAARPLVQEQSIRFQTNACGEWAYQRQLLGRGRWDGRRCQGCVWLFFGQGQAGPQRLVGVQAPELSTWKTGADVGDKAAQGEVVVVFGIRCMCVYVCLFVFEEVLLSRLFREQHASSNAGVIDPKIMRFLMEQAGNFPHDYSPIAVAFCGQFGRETPDGTTVAIRI